MEEAAASDDYSVEAISEPYYFESDHAALKENADYRSLLHSITLLESLRQQAAQDIDTLYKAQDEALADPLKFVERLQKGENLGLPVPIKIPELPEIAWEKYTNNANFSQFATSRHKTRKQKGLTDHGSAADMQSLKSKLLQGVTTTASASSTAPAVPAVAVAGPSTDPEGVVVVRGRAKDSSKPATFNQLWTEEEQQRLENLLVEYPPEEVEAQRWSKIAKALGNRTPIQVASRVQKYFVRLAKEGLPIPGRMPNLAAHSKKGGSSHRHHRYQRYHQRSTFMQSHVPPVWMPDDVAGEAEVMGGSQGHETTPAAAFDLAKPPDMESSDDEDDMNYPEEVINSPEYQELQALRRLRRERLTQERAAHTAHVGYKCDNCGCEPILGTRWHCVDCPVEDSVDFCDTCSIVPFQQDKHDSSHRLQPLKHDVLDSDYMSFTKSNYNYLDSNYMPAT